MAPSSISYDEDKHFLMLLVLNANIPMTKACQEVAPQMGIKAETLR